MSRPAIRLFILIYWLAFGSFYVSAGTVLEAQTINADTQLTTDGSPYEVNGNITVATEITLSIDPGVELIFAQDATVTVNGNLIAEGTSDRPIIARGATGTSWNGIYLNASDVGSTIRYVHISDASYCIYTAGTQNEINNNRINNCQYGVYVYDGSPAISNNIITENAISGIYVTSGNPPITYNTLDQNGYYGVSWRSRTAPTTVSNNIITRNSVGMHDYYGNYTSGYNNVWGNGDDYSRDNPAETDISNDPQYVDEYAADHHLLDSSPSKTASSSNGEIGAYGNGGGPPDGAEDELSTTPTLTGALTQSERWTGEITLTGSVEVNWPHKLIIDAGTVVHMPSDATLKVNNFIRVLGTESSPVVIDGAEGDSWGGLYLNASGAGSTIRYAHISDATYCIRSQGARDEINNNRLSNCQYGVYVIYGSPVISNNIIAENAHSGINVFSGRPQITYNTLDQNGNYGVGWGAQSAPSTVSNNIITRNDVGLYDAYDSYTGGYNNVWGNGDDYIQDNPAETDISSDPQYVDGYAVDHHLLDSSPSKTASSSNSEIGAYGNGGTPPDSTDDEMSTTPTLIGALTQSERWTGEITLTGTVEVNWPYRLIIEAGTVIHIPSGARLEVNNFIRVLGTENSPVVIDGADSGPWVGIYLNALGAGSTIRYAHISGAGRCIHTKGARDEIINNRISNCLDGVYVNDGSPVISNNIITENANSGIEINYGTPQITYNTLDQNGNYGVYSRASKDPTTLSNNIITRNVVGLYDAYDSYIGGYNNVWGNGTDYSRISVAETDISSDPQYADEYAIDHHLLDSSPSKSASSSDGEIGAYGNGGAPPDGDDDSSLSNTPTLTGELTQSERWTGEITLTGSVEVNRPHKLIIDAGTVIHMPSGARLVVNNFIRVLGTEASPVVFKMAEGAGSWDGIYLNAGGAGSTIRYAHISSATYCIRSGGGRDEINNNRLSNCQYGVYIENGSPVINNNIITENASSGIYIFDSNPQITHNTLDQNGNYGVFWYSPNEPTTLSNNIITRNAVGMYSALHSYTSYTGGYNNVWGNGTDYNRSSPAETDISSDPQYVDTYAADHHLLDSSPSKTASSSNGEIGAYGNGGSPPDGDDDELSTTPTLTGKLTQSERWTGEITLTGSVTVDWPHKLIIDAGTVIHMPSDAALTVKNFIRVLGTEAFPVVFKVAEGAGSWDGIYLKSEDTASTIRFAHISGADRCIHTKELQNEINNNRLSDCQFGVYVFDGSPVISNNIITENAKSGIYVYSGAPSITYNTLDQNGEYGLNWRSSSGTVISNNNIITRNDVGLYDNYTGYTGGYNNVWGNGDDYYRDNPAETDISSDPQYVDDDLHLDDTSPSKTASTSGGEIGRYGGISSVPLPTVGSVGSQTRQSTVTLSGTKEPGLGIGVNSSIVVTVNESESWFTTISLMEGDNTLRIYAIDEDGNRSENVSLFITKDATPPQIVSSSPVDGAALIVAVDEITLQISDAHSSIDYDAALESALVIGDNSGLIAGSWSRSSNTLRFAPAESLDNDNYTVTVTLVDEPLANSQTGAITFSIDDGSTEQPAGPELSELAYDGAELADVGVVTNPSVISLVANDPDGIDRIELWIDGELFIADNNGTENYAFNWDIQDFTDGLHTITFIAYDTLGNSSEQSLDVDIQLAAPPVPSLTSPSREYETNESTLEVAGYAQKGSSVYVYNNDNEVAGPLTLDSDDKFSAIISLTDGANNIQIMASNRGGDSSKTAAVTVTLDITPPVISGENDFSVATYDGAGVGSDEPLIALAFALVSALDETDGEVAVSNDAPSVFPVGDTVVTFTATDAAGNVATATATITVSTDVDGDGYVNWEDAFPNNAAIAVDTDGDGLADDYVAGCDVSCQGNVVVDNDDDNDGLLDSEDDYPLDPSNAIDRPALAGELVMPLGEPNAMPVVFAFDESSTTYSVTPITGGPTVTWGNEYRSVKLYQLPDMNGNGAYEYGLFGIRSDEGNEEKLQFYIRDSVTGNKVSTLNWVANWSLTSIVVLDDVTGDGITDIGLQGYFKEGFRPQLAVKDGLTNASHQTYSFPNLWDNAQYVGFSDVTGDGVPEVALYGEIKRNGKRQVKVVDGTDKNNKLKAYTFPANWTDTRWHNMGDYDGDGEDDWGLLGHAIADGRWQLVIKNGVDPKGAEAIYAWPDMSDVTLLRLADANGDGIEEIALGGLNTSGRWQMQIKDGQDRNNTIKNITWPDNWTDTSLHVIGDIDGDGQDEVALLGKDESYELVIKLSASNYTTESTLDLGGDWAEVPTISEFDLDGDGTPEWVAWGLDGSSEVQVTSVALP